MLKKLAIDGGTAAVIDSIPEMFPGGLEIGEEEKQAVIEVIESKNLFRYYGPSGDFKSRVSELEKEYAEFIGTKYALALNSCTSGLVTALIACDVGLGDEVLVPGYTFLASAAAIVNARAVPVMVEVDKSLTMDIEDMEAKITPFTKVIMPVHMRGAPCQIGKIVQIAKKYNLKVIEDVAQANGGSYKGRKLGSFGDINAFSLQYHKVITSGEGGILTTDDEDLFERAVMHHDSGGCWRRWDTQEINKRVKSDDYIPIPGVNYRMNELSGAVGRVQLMRINGIIERMRNNKKIIKDSIKQYKGIEFRHIHDEDGDIGVCLVFFMRDVEAAKMTSRALRAENIPAGSIYDKGVPDWHIYAHWKHIINKRSATRDGSPWDPRYYSGKAEYSVDMCPNTLEYLSRAVMLDIPPQLTTSNIEQICEGLNKVLSVYAQ